MQLLISAMVEVAGVKCNLLRQPGRVRTKKHPRAHTTTSSEPMKGLSETLLVVASLIVTVTFAAPFADPIAKADKKTPAKKIAYGLFMFSNAAALHSSLYSALLLISASLGDQDVSRISITTAMVLVAVSLLSLAGAFQAGAFFVVVNWFYAFIYFAIVVATLLFILPLIVVPLFGGLDPVSSFVGKLTITVLMEIFRYANKICGTRQ